MLIKVEQVTDEWLEARKGLLNASTAASAAGIRGSYDSRIKCFKQYMGETKEVSPPMLYGMEHEDDARHDGEIAVGSLSFPTGIHVHDMHPWLGASTDGVFVGKALHEIKCRPNDPYTTISPQHMAQVQIQLACAGFGQCFFQSWPPSEQRIWTIQRSVDYFEWILPHLKEFWKYVQDEVEPPKRKLISYDGELKTELFYEGATHGISA